MYKIIEAELARLELPNTYSFVLTGEAMFNSDVSFAQVRLEVQRLNDDAPEIIQSLGFQKDNAPKWKTLLSIRGSNIWIIDQQIQQDIHEIKRVGIWMTSIFVSKDEEIHVYELARYFLMSLVSKED